MPIASDLSVTWARCGDAGPSEMETTAALPRPPLLQQAVWALGLLWPVAQAGMPTEPMRSLLLISF